MGTPDAQPLDEAYSKVTNPERFLPLHQWALETVARLQGAYGLALEEGMGSVSYTHLTLPTKRIV